MSKFNAAESLVGSKAKGFRNILVFRTGQLGDTIVSLPAIHAIRARYPHHRLILLTPVQPQVNLVSPLEILGATKIFSQILTYTPPSSRPATWIHQLALAIKIRRLKPEAFFYLRDFPHEHVRRDRFFFQVLAGLKNSYGLDAPKYTFGRRDTSGHLLRFPSEVERLLDIVATADGAVPVRGEVDFGIPISHKESFRIESVWRERGIEKDELIVGFGPGSKMPAKRWPLDRFVEVGRYLLADFAQSRVIIFGGSEDFPLGEEIKQVLGDKIVNMAGQLTVLESAEALRRCQLYVGNDTGVMHLAAAVGTPCVAIFSARDHPGRWEPCGPGHVVLRKEPQCSGCLLEVCTQHGMICLKEIRPAEIVNAIHQLLERAGSAGSVVNVRN